MKWLIFSMGFHVDKYTIHEWIRWVRLPNFGGELDNTHGDFEGFPEHNKCIVWVRNKMTSVGDSRSKGRLQVA